MSQRGMSAGQAHLLAGQKCSECGHALSRHNDLSYCQMTSPMYGDCMCGPDGWSKERMELERIRCRKRYFARKRRRREAATD